jgi:hypothetical protein
MNIRKCSSCEVFVSGEDGTCTFCRKRKRMGRHSIHDDLTILSQGSYGTRSINPSFDPYGVKLKGVHSGARWPW